MIEDLDDEILDFYEKHCAEPGGVVLAHFYHDDGSCESGVFSTLVLANRWAEAISEKSEGSVIFAPHVIDVPEYGNIPDKELN